MLRHFPLQKYSILIPLALSTFAVAGGWYWQYQKGQTDTAQIEQWGILASVQDTDATGSLQDAADKGSFAAARVLGQVLVNQADATSVQKGQGLLLRAAENGDVRASLLLGKLLWKGAPGVPAQPLAARPWLEGAVKGGQVAAAHYLGLIERQDLPGHARSPDKALQWLEMAAKAGFADSQFLLGQMLLLGDGTASNPERARFWFEAAAEQDQPEANLQLLMAYTRHEMGLKRNAEAEERHWMEAQHSLRHRPPPP